MVDQNPEQSLENISSPIMSVTSLVNVNKAWYNPRKNSFFGSQFQVCSVPVVIYLPLSVVT